MTNQMQEAIETFKQKVFKDYENFSYGMWKRDIEENPKRKDSLHSIASESVRKFKDKFRMEETKYYFKFLSENGVHSFIVKEDTIIRKKQWKKGDLLKPASYGQPALNKPRGNILEKYIVQWTGPLYLVGPRGFSLNKLKSEDK